ncbi:MAG: cyclic nucleotide-binding domain-containing protein [Candidatus Sericytochromatia bacterium]|nr:cyclic nucleotide-binding domain-containing protein [Candidatus Tanganyikabacteria bacterium]
MDVRVADNAAQRDDIFRFRYKVYVLDLKKEVQGADAARQEIRDTEDETGILLFTADRSGAVVGTLRLNVLSKGVSDDLRELYGLDQFDDVPAASICVASRFVVAPEAAAAGAALSQYALGWALEHGIKLVFSYCSPHMVASYEALGFRRYKDNFSDPVGYRVPMLLVLFDKDHLRRISSPLYPSIAPTSNETNWNTFFQSHFPEYHLPVNPRMYPQDEFWALLGDKLNSNPLESIPLFRGLTPEQATAVMEAGTIIPIKTGDTLLTAGETGREFYLVLKGMVGVFLPVVEKPISLLGPGEIVGEMAFLGQTPRSADVLVLRDGEVMVLSEKDFLTLADRLPALASQVSLNLARILSERLALTSRALVELQKELTPA